ncbi:hypothetical protein C8Q74DRAFT_1372677 [Fomes fomentarius]|nr:hypothetical protein C8Q74DRAFT_1372677 [Fomes fomentarius]
MHVLSFTPSSLLTLFFAWYLLPLTHAKSYFVVQTPGQGVQWSNNAINPITWEKSLLDGVSSTDIELARMSSDGLIFIAKDGTSTSHITSNPQPSSPASFSFSWTCSPPRIVSASSSTGAINLFIQDIPTGDDYYLLFLNSTHGVMYGASQRFSISDTGNGTAPRPPQVHPPSPSPAARILQSASRRRSPESQ